MKKLIVPLTLIAILLMMAILSLFNGIGVYKPVVTYPNIGNALKLNDQSWKLTKNIEDTPSIYALAPSISILNTTTLNKLPIPVLNNSYYGFPIAFYIKNNTFSFPNNSIIHQIAAISYFWLLIDVVIYIIITLIITALFYLYTRIKQKPQLSDIK